MIEPGNGVLGKMLERLFASMVSGPAMAARPHASRQRVDLFQFSKLRDQDATAILRAVLGAEHEAKVAARVAGPTRSAGLGPRADSQTERQESSAEERSARQAWLDQQSLVSKLRVIADDARTYEQDTGVHALNIGFPLLHLPPGTFGGRAGGLTRRILAPIAFVPVTLTVKAGTRQAIEIACRGGGVDLVLPNQALLAWIEQQTGQAVIPAFVDEEGTDPWREIAGLVRLVAERIGLPTPSAFSGDAMAADLIVEATPRADEDQASRSIILSAVLGLFPTANQGLLNDTREMLKAGIEDGPLESFVRHGVTLDRQPESAEVGDARGEESAGADSASEESARIIEAPLPAGAGGPATPASTTMSGRSIADERLVATADPCQARAVRLARQSRGLIVHGPPGTGKSQTITNVIGDHLARGERVLFVCDKRTALDVVADRLGALGLGDLCATVHDPQRDQRELYRSVREQLDNLCDTDLKAEAPARLQRIDRELQGLRDELWSHHRLLMQRRGEMEPFHQLVGQWLGETGEAAHSADWRALAGLEAADFERWSLRCRETLERGKAVGFASNAWKGTCATSLSQFLANPMDRYRAQLRVVAEKAEQTDQTIDPLHPPFQPQEDLTVESARRRGLGKRLASLKELPAECGKRWAGQAQMAVDAARKQLQAAAGWVDQIRRAPVDPAVRAKRPGDVDVSLLVAEQKALGDYSKEFATRAGEFLAMSPAAPRADVKTWARWMSAEPREVLSAKKRLEGAENVARLVEGSTLDASLHSRFEAALIEPGRVVEWLAALNAYLDIAGKWYAIFSPGKKKAAEPVVKHFGLSLNPQSATSVRQFLVDQQHRTDLAAALRAAAGDALDDHPSDGELLAAFHEHHDLVLALHRQRTTPTADLSASTPLPVAELNRILEPLSSAAAAVLGQYDRPVDGNSAALLQEHLQSLERGERLAELLRGLSGLEQVSVDWPGEQLIELAGALERLFALQSEAPAGTAVGDAIDRALAEPSLLEGVAEALQRSPERASAMVEMRQTLASSEMFREPFVDSVAGQLRANGAVFPLLGELSRRLDTLEGVLRIEQSLLELPTALGQATADLLATECEPAIGFSAIRRNVLAGEIVRRLKEMPELQTVDGQRLQVTFDRYRSLTDAKKQAVRDVVQHHWVSRQRERLLAMTGSRLNSVGVDLRRRLTTRGERAMRLRQAIARGLASEEGDPLFDLRPIWMASPETVAQLFPRRALFDVVIFDEASQCRLEEALPVLTRAKRVVIAGDPRQLPPTRFFESAVSTSAEADPDSDEELFEVQQGEVEDLLTAALGLDVQQAYLDVHYRSRNADLIGFSNEHFYGSRLQAIPAHPRNRTRYSPITLYRADGVYEKRCNKAEAQVVLKIVRDLLKRADPPSIGIACFNLVQRDLILETLEEAAGEDPEFAARLAEARERRGASSSEALFVKNLENVQGDERDHIIISTTYGPDPEGKFRRGFGPLGMAGGGRRLNVLITRARNELHLVTSIPRSVSASLPPIPAGATPGGGWLLFAYLAYAEQLQRDYELGHQIVESAARPEQPSVVNRATRTPSAFAQSLAGRLAADHHHASVVHWGNEGFCVDVALRHPTKPEEVTIGVQTDMTRFAGADDPVEWDVYSTQILESQGWRLHRLWTPHFFRDPMGSLQQIAAAADDEAGKL